MTTAREDALKTAHDDAVTQYRDLSGYDVRITLDGPNWQVDYELKDKQSQGGGPRYLISRETGQIVSRRYWQ